MLITIQSKGRVFRAEVDDFGSWNSELFEAFLDGCRAMGYIITEYNEDLIEGMEDARAVSRDKHEAKDDDTGPSEEP